MSDTLKAALRNQDKRPTPIDSEVVISALPNFIDPSEFVTHLRALVALEGVKP